MIIKNILYGGASSPVSRIAIIGAVLMLSTSFFSPCSRAQHLSSDTLSIKEVVITGVTGPVRLKESPIPFVYIGEGDLRSSAFSNIVDALSHYPGVDQITTGGGISKPVIRGMGYNRVVVVHDGVRQEGQQWGDEHGLEIDAQDVGSVDILKGPASLMYGSDALGGVIVMRSVPEPMEGENRIELSTEFQSVNGLLGSSVFLSGNSGGKVWSARLSGKTAHSYRNPVDSYVPNSQFSERAASAMAGLHKSWGTAHMRISLWNETPSLPEIGEEEVSGVSSYRHGLPYQEISHMKGSLDLTRYLGDGSLKGILSFQSNSRKEFEEEPGVSLLLSTLGYDIRYTLAMENGWTLSTGLGGMAQKSRNRSDEYLIPDYGLVDAGVFLTGSRSFRRWDLSGGVRLDGRAFSAKPLEGRFTSLDRSFGAVSASIGAVFHPVEGLDARLNLSRGFRSPNISELCSNGEHEGTFRYEIGNPSLRPELSHQIDLGLSFSRKWINFEVTGFLSRIDDYIHIHSTGTFSEDGEIVYTYAGGDASLSGLEAVLEIHPLERLHVGNSFSLVEGSFLGQKDTGQKYLPFIPAPRWTFEIGYESPLFRLFARMEHYFAKNDVYSAYSTESPTPAYTLLSLHAGKPFQLGDQVATVSVFCENILDTAYQSHLSRLKYAGFNPSTGREGYFNPGRNLGVKIHIPFSMKR